MSVAMVPVTILSLSEVMNVHVSAACALLMDRSEKAAIAAVVLITDFIG